MNRRLRILAVGAAVFLAATLVAEDAAAQMRKHTMGRSGISGRSSVRMPTSSLRSMSNRGMRTAPRISTPRLSPGASRSRAGSLNRGLSSGSRGSYGRGNYGLGSRGGAGLPDLLNGLGQYGLLDQLYGREDPYYEAQKEQADAIRDAAIINGVANILGVVINGAMQAPPAQYQAPPQGRYEVQRVVIKEGYWYEYQVEVPDQYDPNSGQKILRHYETRQKWVPPVYEERQVWVPYGG
ncbi:MAG: hypothetical protein IT368_04730 [Candidatus Hydrogenedentes bacterium]|nr:hypothetical protein [Candidatus Hydrogenedentota bacterium]